MYSIDEYNKLALKYGPFASWAIWNYKKENDTSVIHENYSQLHSKFVFLGLNISASLINKPWINFHSGRHDRKLKFACNDTKLRGSYITDLFKNIPEANSTNFFKNLNDRIIKENVNLFNQEMKDIKIAKDTQFILFGTPTSLIAKSFNEYFKQEYKNPIIYNYHYSYYGITDKEWVSGLWKKLNIDQNFDLTVKEYK